MSKFCQLTGAKTSVGRNVSHSNRKTLRKFHPNLITKRILIDGKMIKVKMTVRAQRTLAKNPNKFSKQLKNIAKKHAKHASK